MGSFTCIMVFLSYTRDRRLKVSSERLGNEDKAPCPRALLPGRDFFFSYDIFVHGSKFQFIDGINLNLTHVQWRIQDLWKGGAGNPNSSILRPKIGQNRPKKQKSAEKRGGRGRFAPPPGSATDVCVCVLWDNICIYIHCIGCFCL